MIFLALLAMILIVIAYHNEKLYYPILYTLIFLYMVFGTYVIRQSYQFPFFGNVTVYELLFIPLIIAGLFNGSAKYRNFKNIPTKNILIVFLFYYIILTIRNVLGADLFTTQMSYIRIFPFIFMMILVISVPNPTAMVKRLFTMIVFAAFIVSLVSLFISLTGYEMPGLNIEAYTREKRIFWGSVGIYSTATLFIITTFRFASKRYKWFYSIVVLLSIIGVVNTQSRALLLMPIIAILSWAIFTKETNRILKIAYGISIAGISYLFIDVEIMGMYLNRFQLLGTEIDVLPYLTNSNLYFDELGRWGPLIMSLRSNTDFLSIMFGHGYDPGYLRDSIHLHSGFGYIYSSMGIIGLIVVYGLLISTISKYRKFLKKIKIDCFEKEIMRITIYYMTILTVFSLTIGNLVQSYAITGWSFRFGLLELCRRSILNKYYSNSKVLV